MQHPPTDKILRQRSKVRRGVDGQELNLIERYAASKQAFLEHVKERLGAEWFANYPVVNPHKIIEESKTSPMYAAFMCRYACAIIAKLEERSVREYVTAAYFIACDLNLNERAIKMLASEVQDSRYKNGVPTEVVKNNILHYLFLYIFYQSGIRTRDRATQYAQGLKEYFSEGRSPKAVGEIIVEHGPDRLRRVAQRKANLIEGAQEWAKQGKNSAAPSFDEVLAALVAEEAKAATTDEMDDPFDHGSRAVPPDGSDDQDSDVSDDDEQGVQDEQPVEPTKAGEQRATDVNTADDKDVEGEDRSNPTNEAGFIDGEVIDKRLHQILSNTMSLGASLMELQLDPDVKKHVARTTVLLSNDLLELRRMINGV